MGENIVLNLNKITNVLRKVAWTWIHKGENIALTYDVKKQEKYMEKLGVPRDEIERSYFQYKCQMKLYGVCTSFLFNVASIPMLIVYWLKSKNVCVDNCIDKKDAIFFREGFQENILPNSLKKKFDVIETDPAIGFILTPSDKEFVKKVIKRYPFSWHFILKCLIKIEMYSYAMERYSPNAIIVRSEFSFTSSVMTAYCRERNVKHINVMHGEKIYFMRDSFFEFDAFYVWDEYYSDLMISMKADESQFIVEVPDALNFGSKFERNILYDYTYYLQGEPEKILKKISEILEELNNKGKKISVRPHPRYSKIDMVKKYFQFANIEDVKHTTIEKSLSQTAAAISLGSTVLNQARYNSIPSIVDDVSSPIYFRKLKDIKHICIGKKHKLLSQVLNEMKF